MEMASQPDDTPSPTAPDGKQVPVVAIGASAGGVQALINFFAHMRPDANMAFVVILHLPLESESKLAAILQRQTAMSVKTLAGQMPISANHVYIMPSNTQLSLADGIFSLHAFEKTNGVAMPIDQCFRAIAEAYGSRSAAIILSGTGSDGASGIKRIKEAGGVTLVQDPQDAQFSGMPHMAISTGLVDFVLPVTALPEMLITYWQRSATVATTAEEADADILPDIFAILRARTRHDFSHYKRPTMRRRLARRMQVTGATDLPAYLALLRNHPDEVQALLRDLLISVTNFFRDRDTWITLQTFIPQLFANKGPADTVRVWVTACATGEEAYTLAILLREFANTLDRRPAIQVFATDIDDQAIAIARQGIYPESIAGDVSPARLARFFVADQGGYHIKQDLRDLVLFARHNVLHDPPFSQVDLITCRNLLIYLNREAQDQVIETFHFALRPQGFLLLGSSESLDGTAQLFATVDKGHRVFQRRPGPTTPPPIASVPLYTTLRPALPATPDRSQPIVSFGELHQRLIGPYIPPSVIVSEDGEIVHLGRGVSPFLHFGEGEPSHNLLKVVQPNLRPDLRSALFMAREHGQTAHVRRAQVPIDGETRLVNMIVEPIVEPQWARGHLLVLFQDVGAAHGTTGAPASDTETLITQLEAELEHANTQLRTIGEQYETVVEEYKAANEELQAINEELRAASEELETSREEVQSVNEELTTVNEELKHKVEEVSSANNDLQNLMTSTQIGTLFLDRDLCIKRFTPSVRQIFNLIPADLGRPLHHVTHALLDDGLMLDAAEVLHTLEIIRREVATRDDTWYLMQILPYRTVDGHVEGVVLTFVDITERKRAEAALRESEDRFRTLFETMGQGYAVCELVRDSTGRALDHRLIELNPAFERLTGVSAATARGRLAREVFPNLGSWWIEAFDRIVRQGQPERIEYEEVSLGQWYEVYVYPGQGDRFIELYEDITERKRAEERQAFLLKLSDALRTEPNADAVANRALEMLVEQLRLDRSYITTYYLDENRADLDYQIGNDSVPPLPDHFVLSDYPEAFKTTFEHTVVIEDDLERQGLSEAEKRNSEKLGMRAMVAATLRKEHKPLWSMVVINSRPRRWTADEIALVEEVAERTWATVERARAEVALREREERFRALLSKGTDMITISARDGTILYASPSTERVSGYSAEEFQGSNPFRDAIHPEDMALCRDAMERLSATPGLSLTIQHRARHKSGGWRWYEGTFTSLFHEPAIGGLVANVRDITERKQAEAERERLLAAEHTARAHAEAALKTREQFLSIASHELRTPLTSLIGYVYLLPTLAENEPAALNSMAERIMRQAQRLNNLIDQLLDVSRLQRGQFVIERRPVDIAAIVAQAVDELRVTQLPNTKHPIEIRCPEQPLLIAGDAQRLEQVIANLLTNAVKYSPAGGTIRVEVTRTAAAAVVEVIDPGIGIPAEAQERLFEPFYRAGNVGAQTSGFGLGLHIVREIVRRHGGRIEVDSAEDQGSTFRVVLPLLDAPEVD